MSVKDVDRSREFYTDLLGFKLVHNFSPHYLAVLTPNKLQIGFHPGKGSAKKSPGLGIEFEVDHVDSWYQRLKRHGIRFVEKPKDAWGEREARFLDPDGYSLAISSPLPRRKG